MKKGQNFNHPKKGSRTTVDPIREEKDIKAIARLLSSQPRNLLLYTLGINNGIRPGDLLLRQFGEIRRLKVGDTFPIIESKTKKKNFVAINKSIYKTLDQYLSHHDQFEDHHYLFQSRKGENNPLTVPSLNGLVKNWTRSINLKGNYGAHTLRKTWGYIQRTKYGVSMEIIANRFGHSNPQTTWPYLGIAPQEIHDALMNEVG